MLRDAAASLFCIFTCTSLFYCGKGFVLRVTRDRSGDLFSNFESLCVNITQGKLGCEAKKADCVSSTDCCSCRCRRDFSTFRVATSLTESTCIDNSKARYECGFHFRSETLAGPLVVLNLNSSGVDRLLYKGAVIPFNVTLYGVTRPIQYLDLGTWVNTPSNPFNMSQGAAWPYYYLQWTNSLEPNYNGRLVKVPMSYTPTEGVVQVTSCIVFKVYGVLTYNVGTSLYSSSAVAQSYLPSTAGVFVTSTHGETTSSANHMIFSPTPQIHSTTHKEHASPSQIQSQFKTPHVLSSTWSTLYEKLTTSPIPVRSSLVSRGISSSVASGSSNTSADATGKGEGADRLIFIVSGTSGAVIICVLVVVLALVIIQRRRKDSFLGVTKNSNTTVFKKPDPTDTAQSTPTTADDFSCPSTPKKLLCRDSRDGASADNQRTLLLQRAVQLLSTSQGNTLETTGRTKYPREQTELFETSTGNYRDLVNREAGDYHQQLGEDSQEQEQGLENTIYSNEDEYEVMRGSGQPPSEELYANCMEDTSSYINYESDKGEIFDDDIYENDRRHTRLMFVNGVSIAEVYVNESPTKDEGYMNIGGCGKNSRYEGDYVYAQNIPQNRSPKIASTASLSPTVIEKDLGKSKVGKERPVSRSGAVECHLSKVNYENEHDGKSVYENNTYALMAGNIELIDDGKNKDRSDSCHGDDYVRMHSSTDGHVDNGGYVTTNQEQGIVNDGNQEDDQIYANTQFIPEYDLDDENFYVNIPK